MSQSIKTWFWPIHFIPILTICLIFKPVELFKTNSDEYNHTKYFISTNKASFTNASEFCRYQFDGELAIVKSRKQWKNIISLISKGASKIKVNIFIN